MVAVNHREADSHGFCLRAFDDREELAVATGAPDDFLSAHFSVCLWMKYWLACGRARQRVESDGVGSARVLIK